MKILLASNQNPVCITRSLHTVCQCANCISFFRQGVCQLNMFLILTSFLVFVGLRNTASVSCANSMREVIKLSTVTFTGSLRSVTDVIEAS